MRAMTELNISAIESTDDLTPASYKLGKRRMLPSLLFPKIDSQHDSDAIEVTLRTSSEPFPGSYLLDVSRYSTDASVGLSMIKIIKRRLGIKVSFIEGCHHPNKLYMQVSLRIKMKFFESSPVQSPRKAFNSIAPTLSRTASEIQTILRKFLSDDRILVDFDIDEY